ncbi:4-hydroxythreonine-4-phosphate dehydrogenase PdxA [Rhizosaccharibacter radicis]|uniref:4-hydroxythreonine-4-phosphate dehydrogenase n=1 Tax=Rhizosaccharibacter radicis TaxID=2782605 RepID=A0ABT1VZW7_9PROT|nr:4-hydroxythreonine-4-phosphate dehydrogenase PdxA [Acetobacteraceae bacterium KSS12]
MLALTMGDPAGIGGEIALGAWTALREDETPFVMLADPRWLSGMAGGRGIAVRPVDSVEEAGRVFAEALPVLPVPLPAPAIPGHPNPANGSAVTASIERAVRLATENRVGGIVTNPISKIVLKRAGFAHPGHTEFLGALTGQAGREVMMLAGPSLRVVPVTVHLSLRDAIDKLSTDLIVSVARTAAASLRRDFGIASPRLAVAGLNPHAGENGLMGEEERTLVAPAIAALRAEGIEVIGPLPPDTMFTALQRERYDAAICMYHDQALIPLKTLDMAHGVNVTIGLDLVRTSPDHGTAFDIAGRHVADPTSLISAIRLADIIRRNRARANRSHA